MDKYLTEKELLKILKVSRTTLFMMRQYGMPFIQLGRMIRYQFEDVQQWISKYKV